MRLDLDQLALQVNLPRKYVRDNLVKRPGFPRPLVLSRFVRFWLRDEVEAWMLKQRAPVLGRPRSPELGGDAVG